MELSSRLDALADEYLPAFGLMLGRHAPAMLATAPDVVFGEPEVAEPRQILWDPGKRLVVRYRVAISGGKTTEVVAATGTAIPAAMRDGTDAQVVAWRIADDPWLPGLAPALSTGRVRDMLDTIGVRPGSIRLSLRTYRPTRRAVVEATHADVRVFLKVVPPHRAETLQAAHRDLSTRSRVPRSLGWSRDLGIVVLAAVEGATLRSGLGDPSRKLPHPKAFLDLLRSLPATQGMSPVAGPLNSVRRHVRLLERVVPECSALLEELGDRCADATVETSDPVHGDFHPKQILTRHGSIVGLLDVDGMGVGRRVDDLGTFLGHLLALEMSARDSNRIGVFRNGLMAAADRVVEPRELRRVTAAKLVALATGPFRVQTVDWPTAVGQRLQRAVGWLSAADSPTLGERGLTDASATSHPPLRSYN